MRIISVPSFRRHVYKASAKVNCLGWYKYTFEGFCPLFPLLYAVILSLKRILCSCSRHGSELAAAVPLLGGLWWAVRPSGVRSVFGCNWLRLENKNALGTSQSVINSSKGKILLHMGQHIIKHSVRLPFRYSFRRYAVRSAIVLYFPFGYAEQLCPVRRSVYSLVGILGFWSCSFHVLRR